MVRTWLAIGIWTWVVGRREHPPIPLGYYELTIALAGSEKAERGERDQARHWIGLVRQKTVETLSLPHLSPSFTLISKKERLLP
jgi:hypothetical protein